MGGPGTGDEYTGTSDDDVEGEDDEEEEEDGVWCWDSGLDDLGDDEKEEFLGEIERGGPGTGMGTIRLDEEDVLFGSSWLLNSSSISVLENSFEILFNLDVFPFFLLFFFLSASSARSKMKSDKRNDEIRR